MTDRNHKILLTLLALTIVGEIASIIVWYTQPDLRLTLIVNYQIASLAAAIAAILNIIALIDVLRKSKWGPILVIAISIPNRILGLFLFLSPASTGVFAIWTLLLVVFAYLDYKK